MKLSDCSLLVALNISQWTARKYDKNATKEIAIKHGIDSVVGRYNKSLMPFTDMLNNINNASTVLRTAFYTNTLPYTYEGVRLLPSRNYLDFVTLMNGHIANRQLSVDMFLAHYMELVDNAEDNLGPLYNPTDYPTPEAIKEKFSVNLTVSPVPDSAGFYDILTEAIAKERADELVKKHESTAHKAMQECWQRLYAVVSKFPEKLVNETKSLRVDHVHSMIHNAEEMCELLAKLNILNDPNLEAMRLEVQKLLCGYSPEVVSSHDVTKEKIRADAEAIMRKMSAFMGPT